MKDKRLSNSILLIVCGALVVIIYLLFTFCKTDSDTTMLVLSNIALAIGIVMIIIGTVFICIRKPRKKVAQHSASRKAECEICGAMAETDANGCCQYCGERLV